MPALSMLRKICYEILLMDLMMYGEAYLKFDAKIPTENVLMIFLTVVLCQKDI